MSAESLVCPLSGGSLGHTWEAAATSSTLACHIVAAVVLEEVHSLPGSYSEAAHSLDCSSAEEGLAAAQIAVSAVVHSLELLVVVVARSPDLVVVGSSRRLHRGEVLP